MSIQHKNYQDESISNMLEKVLSNQATILEKFVKIESDLEKLKGMHACNALFLLFRVSW